MKRLLFFPGYRIIAYEWSAGAFRRIEAFEPDDDGRAAFRRWLAEAPRKPVQMLIDVIEEEFHVDSIPHVIGRERVELYRRTAQKHFRNNEFRYIINQGRVPSGRRDDQVLVAGLTNPELLNNWLDIIAEVQVPLRGIYSLPLVGEHLLPPLGADRAERALVVSQQVPSTLRQSYYERGRLRFSRLVPGRYEGPQEYAEFVHAELHRTLHFLENQRFRGRGNPVTSYILTDSSDRSALRERLADVTATTCNLVPLENVAASLRMRGVRPGTFADTIFAQLLLRGRRISNHYGLARLRRFFFVQRARMGMYAAAAAMTIAAAAVVGMAWVSVQAYDRGTTEAEAHEARFQRLYEARLSQLDEFQYRAVDVKHAVDLLTHAAGSARQVPTPAMDLLGGVLVAHPAVQVERIEWSRSSTGNSGDREPRTRSLALKERENESLVPELRVSGRIEGFEGEYRLAIDRFNAFVRDLEEAGAGEVQVDNAPFALASDTDITGDSGTAAGAGRDERADFALQLRMPRPAENGDG